VREVRVIGENSEQLGVMTPEDALVRARDVGLDLVEVAAASRPPVCRIMDYGRYKYEQKKKKAKSSKGSHAATLKEIKLRPGTDQHDLDFKLANVRKFLMEGDKVKVTVMFRGREMVHIGRGREQLQHVYKLLNGLAKMENPPRMEGRFMSMILVGEREAIADAKRVAEAEQPEEAPEEPTGPSKAERRAAKQQRVEDANETTEEPEDDEAHDEAEKTADEAVAEE
jgi:translation initiation factor IF-3